MHRWAEYYTLEILESCRSKRQGGKTSLLFDQHQKGVNCVFRNCFKKIVVHKNVHTVIEVLKLKLTQETMFCCMNSDDLILSSTYKMIENCTYYVVYILIINYLFTLLNKVANNLLVTNEATSQWVMVYL